MNEETNNPLSALSEDELFIDVNKPNAGWFKFVNLGDRIMGVLITKMEQETPGFSPQLVFTVQTKDGSIMNVAVKKTQYFITRASQAQIGDVVGFEYKAEIPPKQKGHQAGKQIEMYIKKINGGDVGVQTF